MPIYEYRCGACEETHEALRKVAEMNDPAACPACGKECQRIISSSSFKFGGADGKATEQKMLSDRKKAYWNGDTGKEELRSRKEYLAKKYGAV